MGRKLILFTLMFWHLVGLLTGCGYRFGGGDLSPAQVRASIYIAPFENKTKEAYINNYLRSALLDWFIKSTQFMVVTKEEDADMVLSGKIRHIYTVPISYRSGGLAAEEKVKVSMEITLKDRRSGRVIWEERNMVGEQDYSVIDPNRREDNRRTALIKLANDIGERIYRPATTRF